MANHVRQQIRDAVAVMLGGLSLTGSRVFKNRLQRLDEADLPCLLISTDNEQISPQTFGINAVLERDLTLTIKAIVQDSVTYADDIDTVIKDVEQVISLNITNNTLAGLVKTIRLQSIEFNDDGQGEQPIAEATMNFSVSYYTLANTPDSSI